ncbi:histidine--tRNA ligase [Candidatus Uhrbacteria bacterium CG_4_9_14_3_um_filter_41_35]|uniref:Histidine--tRNA ligase n=1 Tax=Candidatus Uhrbacteria bacterium CG_4_9_14_3_um_filter_41_35 TaxID=1975034 RepID=A0A2M7XG13_9BACT|nr:MAG: histidine--tRNA ligase [Candidatus Uhrbacteria bacterium CG11_big_fil_rev_8_21_14_0_20_41_9]PJA46799.1 MAG: histidine--tRNA ligase [Candidatus Uhrbacteria bacterium CG_4_9_14_3_um_filter_41_35]
MAVKKVVVEEEEVKSKPKAKAKPKAKKVKVPNTLRGFRDVLPDEQFYWDMVIDKARQLSDDYSFGRVRLPLLEKTSLFERSVGKGTDIVEKEMFSFADQSNDRVTLRPEATAQIARAYIEHGMLNMPQPVKMYYIGQMFRYDRPQAGRYRQFWQWGLEAIGSDEPIIDAQVILVCVRMMQELGLDVMVKINSIGTEDIRRGYTMELVSYFKQFRSKLSELDKKRLTKNPLRLLDSKEEGIEELKADAPQILDHLDEKSKADFMKVLEYLDEVEVPYELDPFLVRGLDYYSKTVFEIVAIDKEGKQGTISLAGGGRYDSLIPQLGGRSEAGGAMGAAVGIERVINAMKHKGIDVPKRRKVDVFFAQLGEAARRKGLAIFEKFRAEGIVTAEAFGKGSLKAQLEMADKLEAKITLILGQKEVLDGTVIIRDMESGGQEIVPIEKVVELAKRSLNN